MGKTASLRVSAWKTLSITSQNVNETGNQVER